MDLTATFSGIPNVTSLDGMTDAWHWAMAPGFDFSAALSEDRKHAFQAYALDSFDEDFAVALLSFARANGAELIAEPERPLVAVEGFAHPGYAFDMVVAIGPTVHRYHEQDAEVREVTRALLPAFRCEFAGDEDEADTQYRYARAAGVPGTKWDREPRPYLKMRHRTDSGRLQGKRGFVNPPSLVSWVTSHEASPDLFVELENFRHDVYTIEWSDTWTLTGPDGEPTMLSLDELLDTVKTVLYGPNLAAGTGEFTK